ncbi:MAG: hypothetical protein RLZZ299_1526 [Pseudomonadota bacterium]
MVASLLSFWLFVLASLPVGWAAPANPFRVEARPLTVAPGGQGTLTVVLAVPERHHVYRDMLDVRVLDAAGLTLRAPSYPPGVSRPDPANPSQMRESYEDDVWVELPVRVPASTKAGSHPVRLQVRYQGCNASTCYFPQEETLDAQVVVGASRPGASRILPIVGEARAETPPAEEVAVRLLSGAGPSPGTVAVRFDLQGDWHVNRAFVAFGLPASAGGWTLGTVDLPAGEKSGSPADGTEREDYTHDLDIVVPLAATGDAREVDLEVSYQACKGATLCRMPTTETLRVSLDAPALPALGAPPKAEPAAAASVEPPAPPPPADDAFVKARGSGMLALVALCFVAGLGVSLTPCVLPMVPITMGILGARSAGSRLRALSLSGAYVLGLALVYTALGVFAGVTGALFGSWLQSAWVVGSIAAFFFAMGLSMFGVFDVAVPGALQARLGSHGGGGSLGGALILGMVGAVLAGPCSGPVVASVLALIGQGGEVGLGAGLMFAFSLGMGMIFLVTGAASGWMPSRGAWMDTVKKAFGVVMWLGAIYYVAPQLPVVVTALATAFVLLWTAVFAWPDPDDGEGFVLRRGRILVSVVAGLVGAYLLLGVLLTRGFVLAPVGLAPSGAASTVPTVTWMSDEAAARARAQAEGKPLLIDFTAEWCAACHELDRYTFSDPAVAAAIREGFVAVRVDCTDRADAAVTAIQQRYGVLGLPTVVVARPDGTRVDATIGFVEAAPFLARIRSAATRAVGG